MDFPERPDSPPERAPRRPRRHTGGLGPEQGEDDRLDVIVGDPDNPPPPVPRQKSKGRGRSSETLARVLWAIPAIVLAVTVVALGGEIFAAAMVVFAWIGMVEFFRMTERARPFTLVAFLAAAGMITAAHFGDSFQMVLAGVAFFPVMLGFVIARGSLHNVTYSMAVTVFAIIWIGLPFAHAVLLRDLPDHGAALLVDVLVATFFTDTFAYLGGRMVGSRPLAPTISPNKTVEGLVIGIAGGTLGFFLAGLYQDWLSNGEALLMGVCIAAIAPLGDLFESAIKRDLDIKDSGRVFGPHGGLLDRLDAVLFTVVAGYYLSLAVVF
ncbi:MAG TPA: phosphatidate cytidylyltransferase [Solirubrobacterales bacterium]|nr:phosphatidate cytidylyltransferase [Solirubrobacterales bacterium]